MRAAERELLPGDHDDPAVGRAVLHGDGLD
jgi:hypothetical protein